MRTGLCRGADPMERDSPWQGLVPAETNYPVGVLLVELARWGSMVV